MPDWQLHQQVTKRTLGCTVQCTRPGQSWQIDSRNPLPLSQGYHWVLTTVIPFLGTTQQFPLAEQTQAIPFENS